MALYGLLPHLVDLFPPASRLSYVLNGLSGFQELLLTSKSSAVQAATARALRELAEQQRQRGKEGCQGWAQGEELMLSLLAVLRRVEKQELVSERLGGR